MSETDARMAFERHATSKIVEIGDLDHIYTFGFRGEALAAIAAVAEVELKTRRKDSELGLRLLVSASKVISGEPVHCPAGSGFSVKNLFYNTPARRKFLKSDASELKQIINEFHRVTICNPDIEFSFNNNGTQLYNLPTSNLKQRLAGIFGKSIAGSLIDVNIETSMVKITGFIGKSDKAKKSPGEQFFFVNNRFFRSPYLQKAVYKAYEQLLPSDMHPSFFLFFDMNPADVDINIHPQKIEVKFENEQAIWQILNAVVRESLSKYAVVPPMIFDMKGAPDIPVLGRNTRVAAPEITVDRDYNPFQSTGTRYSRPNIDGWEHFYNDFNKQSGMLDAVIPDSEPEQQTVFDTGTQKKRFLQIKDRYIATPVKSGLMLIDICRAHQRILFEEFMLLFQADSAVGSQQQLFPETVELSPSDFMLIQSVRSDLEKMGFSLRSFDNSSIVFCALPAGLEKAGAKNIVDEILRNIKEDYNSATWDTHEKLAVSLAKAESVKKCGILNDVEMEHLVDRLFACKQPDIDAEGKPAISIIEIEKLF
jgi:DNA mismatch repair protein MutL